jgi:hypothetical protein
MRGNLVFELETRIERVDWDENTNWDIRKKTKQRNKNKR